MTLAAPTKKLFIQPGRGTDTVHNTDTGNRPASLGINPNDGNEVGPAIIIPGTTPTESC